MNLELAILGFGGLVTFLVMAGLFLSFFAPAYREAALREKLRQGRIPASGGGRDAR